MTRLGILKTGVPPKGMERFGSYPEMFRALLGEGAYDYRTYDIEAGELPESAEECPAYLVTGSASGAYEDLPWIAPLEGFLRAARGRAALVGICFGHQVMAQAFGGAVIKSPKGRASGAHRYEIVRNQPWMDADAPFFSLPAEHGDQVVELPPGAEVIAASEFTPFGMLAWPGERAFSLQLHPEFTADYATALIERRLAAGQGDPDAAQAAIESLEQPLDQARVGRWIANFLAA